MTRTDKNGITHIIPNFMAIEMMLGNEFKLFHCQAGTVRTFNEPEIKTPANYLDNEQGRFA